VTGAHGGLLEVDSVRSSTTRATTPVITDFSEKFSGAWPAVEARLRPRLLRRGLPTAHVDDVLQETAIAALRRQVPFTTEDDLLAWCTVVARRLAVAEHRRGGRTALLSAGPPEVAAGVHVEREVLARLDLDRVVEAARRLAPAERAALGSVVAVADRREAVRLNVRRHRARQKLVALAGGFGLVATLFGVLRRLRSLSPVAVPIAASVVIAGALAALDGLEHGRPGPADRRVVSDAERAATVHAPAVSLAPAESATIVADGPASTGPGAPADEPELPGSPEGIAVDLAPPLGPEVGGRARPKQEAEPELCLQAGTPEGTCADVDLLPSTPLDDISIFDRI
jgi:hypothetical protein